jgi:hypothetical protein
MRHDSWRDSMPSGEHSGIRASMFSVTPYQIGDCLLRPFPTIDVKLFMHEPAR